MADRLIFEVVAEGKGLKVVQRQADSLARSVERTNTAREKAGKGQNSYNKREKAIHQSNLSSAKGFSKMNQTMGSGSSGLVGAYATLAANVFAATAAFNALRRAAQLEQLIAGLEQVGAAAGRNLTFAAEKLREVSGFALSTEQAMRNMALGVSAGFGTDQMEGLTKVARGASIALGRDMADAMDRLTRGAAKLEPEILDELGIMVRLDTATQKYAATMGRQVTQLTQFERRQAFLNAILEQGELKFGQLADSIEPAAYDKLAATLGDLVKEISNLVNKALGPLANMLSNNMAALTGVLVLFGSTITKQLLPGLSNMAKGSAQAATGAATAAKAQLSQLKVTGQMPAAYTAATQAMQSGGLTQDKYNKGVMSLTRSTKMHQMQIAQDPKKYAAGTVALKNKTLAMKENDIAMKQLNTSYHLHGAAQAKSTLSTAIEQVQQKNLAAGYRFAAQAIAQYSATTMGAVASSNQFARSLAGVRVALFATAAAAKTAGAAIMASLGWISLLATAGIMLYDIFKDKLFPEDPIEEEAKSILDSLGSITETAKSFEKTMNTVSDPAHVAVAGYKALTGVLTEVQSGMKTFIKKADEAAEASTSVFQDQIDAQQLIAEEAAEKASNVQLTIFGQKTTATVQAEKLAEKEADKLAKLEDKKSKAVEEANKVRKDSLVAMIGKTIEGLESQPGMKEFASGQISLLETLAEDIKTMEGKIGLEDLTSRMETILTPVASINAAFAGATDAASNFAAATNKLVQKEQTPFDKAIDAAEDMAQKLADIDTAYNLMGGEELPDKLKKEKDELIRGIREQMGVDVKLGDTTDLKNYTKRLNENRDTIITTKAKVASLNKEHSKLKGIVKAAGTKEALREQLKLEEEIRTTKLEGVNATIDNTRMLLGNITKERLNAAKALEDQTEFNRLTRQKEEATRSIADLEIEQKSLQNQKLSDDEKEARLDIQAEQHAQKLLAIQNKILASNKANLKSREDYYKNEKLIAIAQDPSRLRTTGVEMTAGEQLEAFYKFENEKRELIEKEYTLKEKSITAEKALNKARHALLEAEIRAKMETGEIASDAGTEILASIKDVPALMDKAAVAAQAAALSAKDAALKGLDVEKAKAHLAARSALIEGAGGMGNLRDNIKQMQMHAEAFRAAAVEKFRQQAIKEFANKDKLEGAALVAAAQKHAEELIAGQGGEDAIGRAAIDKLPMIEKLKLIGNMSAPLIEQLKQLGPQGELASVVAQGALAMADGWSSVGEVFNRTAEDGTKSAGAMEKAIAVANAVATTVSQTAAIMAAASQARIAAIDAEIAAEKKRDGKSAQSLSKIKGLEKKREAMARKAFEQNKKMQMASIIANTAAGVMGVIGHESGKVGILSIVLAGIVAAMGAAQLAIVAGTSYQGGSSGIGSSAPKSIGIGERSSKVDLGRSGNASGELAYLRGERGVGSSASDFRPGAFAGKRYRAAGGTAYVVGEQGPELFMPETPGQIVTNDNAAAMGAPVNVSFQVSAIDSSNMQDMLTSQRGNIISMIREAANTHGSGFLEEVDVDSYNPGAGGSI